jgi:hypothetical protein
MMMDVEDMLMVHMMGSCTEHIVADGALSIIINIPMGVILANMPENLQVDEMIASIHPIPNFLLLLN